MTHQRNGIGTLLIVIAVIGVIAIGTVAFVMYSTVSTPPSDTTTSSSSSTLTTSSTSSSRTESSTTYSTSSSSGLNLQVTLNTTRMEAGSPLLAQVTLSNTLASSLSLAVNYSADPNIANWDTYDTLCGLSSVVNTFGFALFDGHYTAGNFSQASIPVLLSPPIETSCPNRFCNQAYVQNVEFAPDSSFATLSANASFSGQFKALNVNMEMNATTGSCLAIPYEESGTSTENGVTSTSSGTELSLSCGSNGANTLNGYWTAPGPGATIGINGATNSTIESGIDGLYGNFFHQFSPGSYTIVAQDMWNQTTFGYFQVVPSSTSTTTSAECTISAEGTGFYVTVLSDSGQPIRGAQVSGTRVTEIGVGTCTQDIGTYITNSTGSLLITPNIGSYYQLSITYQGDNYSVKAPIEPMTTTYVTLRVPSGNVTISEVFEGGCQTNSEGVSCPG